MQYLDRISQGDIYKPLTPVTTQTSSKLESPLLSVTKARATGRVNEAV